MKKFPLALIYGPTLLLISLGVGCVMTGRSLPQEHNVDGYITIEVAPAGFDPERFTEVFDELVEHCPLNAPVMVGLTYLDGAWGQTTWHEERGCYIILIDPRQSFESILDTLVHEWAHAMVWDSAWEHHGPLWGVAWAQAYRAMIGEGFEEYEEHECYGEVDDESGAEGEADGSGPDADGTGGDQQRVWRKRAASSELGLLRGRVPCSRLPLLAR